MPWNSELSIFPFGWSHVWFVQENKWERTFFIPNTKKDLPLGNQHAKYNIQYKYREVLKRGIFSSNTFRVNRAEIFKSFTILNYLGNRNIKLSGTILNNNYWRKKKGATILNKSTHIKKPGNLTHQFEYCHRMISHALYYRCHFG